LGHFIEENMSEEAIDAMVEDHGYYIDMRNREYWEEELDQASMPG